MIQHALPHTTGRTRRYRIVTGIDLTEYCEIVLEHALDQAARHEAPDMHFLFVNEHEKETAKQLEHRMTAIVYPALQTFNRFGTNWRARLHVRAGKASDQIAMLAADIRADLIVIGQFGLHNPSPTLKSVPGRVLQAAPCPTLVVGMPPELDIEECPACASWREVTDGERWFCDDHRAPDRIDHTMTPSTVWSNGSLM